MFTNTYLPHVGGVARSVNFFSEDLVAHGHEVLIVAPSYPDCEEIDKKAGNIIRSPAIQNFNASDFSLRIPAPFYIDEKIDEFEPDIIHSHHPYLLGDAALRAARRRGLPLVFTHHTLYEEYTHYISEDSETLKRFARNLSTEYANLCTTIIAPSESIAELITDRGVVEPIEVIPTGVDVDFFATGNGKRIRDEYRIPEKTPLIGHLGRLAPEKNLDYLAKAVSLYLQKDDRSMFIVAGGGSSEDNIRKVFEDADQSDRLIMAGVVKGQKLADIYNAMDIFVFASKSETQGMVLTEAMAAGTPIVALDASGVREVVEDNRNGRLLPHDADQDMFADAISEFFQSEDKARRWRKETTHTADAFSRESSVKKLIRLYTSVIETTESTTDPEELVTWDEFLEAVKAEWDLLSEKARAIYNTIQQNGNSKVDIDV